MFIKLLRSLLWRCAYVKVLDFGVQINCISFFSFEDKYLCILGSSFSGWMLLITIIILGYDYGWWGSFKTNFDGTHSGEEDPMVVCILLIAPFVLGIFTRQTWKFVIELMGSFVFFISFGGCPNSDLQILLFSSVECS